jgi:hypothetical protein
MPDVVVFKLYLAGMQSNPDLEAEISHRPGDLHGALDSPRRSVERRKEAVARSIHLTATEPSKEPSDSLVVRGDELLPRPIAYLGSTLGRAHDFGDHHRGEHPVEDPLLLLDLREEGLKGAIHIGTHRKVLVIRNLDVARPRDLLGDPRSGPPVTALDVATGAHHQRRHVDLRQDGANVNLLLHVIDCESSPWARGQPRESGEPLDLLLTDLGLPHSL